MMRGRGSESKNVSGLVLEKVPPSVDGWRPGEGGAGTGGSEELRMGLGMVATDWRRCKEGCNRVIETRRMVRKRR